MKALNSIFAAVAASLVLVATAQAGIETSTLNVSFTAIAACTVSTGRVDFGSGTGLTPVYGTGDVTVNCSSGIPYNITLDAGLNYQRLLTGKRSMSDGINYIAYALSGDSQMNTEWGDADYDGTYPFGTSVVDTGTGGDQLHSVYGVTWSGQALPVGEYSDTVTVTVYY